jgi:predicted nucleic acid-binding protein
MLDTNVLISLLLFPNSHINAMMDRIFTDHELVLSSFVVSELKDVVQRKFPAKEKAMDELLQKMSYDFSYTPEEMDETLFNIRDAVDIHKIPEEEGQSQFHHAAMCRRWN